MAKMMMNVFYKWLATNSLSRLAWARFISFSCSRFDLNAANSALWWHTHTHTHVWCINSALPTHTATSHSKHFLWWLVQYSTFCLWNRSVHIIRRQHGTCNNQPQSCLNMLCPSLQCGRPSEMHVSETIISEILYQNHKYSVREWQSS